MWLEILILLTAIPVGFLIAYMTEEELKDGRKYFRLIFYLSVSLAIIFSFINRRIESLSLAYLAITSFISYIKSK
jgi:hypothetical protein